jgi:hypothetical protein
MNHAFPVWLCEDESAELSKGGIKMDMAKRLFSIIKEDKKLWIAFGGALVDGIILISVIVVACLWFLV